MQLIAGAAVCVRRARRGLPSQRVLHGLGRGGVSLGISRRPLRAEAPHAALPARPRRRGALPRAAPDWPGARQRTGGGRAHRDLRVAAGRERAGDPLRLTRRRRLRPRLLTHRRPPRIPWRRLVARAVGLEGGVGARVQVGSRRAALRAGVVAGRVDARDRRCPLRQALGRRRRRQGPQRPQRPAAPLQGRRILLSSQRE